MSEIQEKNQIKNVKLTDFFLEISFDMFAVVLNVFLEVKMKDFHIKTVQRYKENVQKDRKERKQEQEKHRTRDETTLKKGGAS